MRPDFVTTGSTVYAVNEIVSYLKPVLTGNESDIDKVSEIIRHVGRFDKPDEIKNWLSKKDGGIRIAAMRVRNIEQVGGQMTGDIDFVAFVFCTEQFAFPRDERAEVIAGRLAKYLLANKGVPTANGKAKGLSMDNLYSGDIDGLGLALWSVSWSQNWVLDKPLTAEDLDDFVTFHASAEIADGAPAMGSDITLDQ
ncbi:hypothetical protein A8139_00720 [Marinomonas primoryensis]|uniref:Uncharacterized protein n=1 Tax=Marinomonas primoryensis TaxID=178399 RepID=A0A2Z4PME1_9GAMM|nr:hypothetical protein [Marinomonas primoryensis]AWX98561.1 hypothetical protein A8139_00085 [Marinomonas primoryensis]AWX98675.1 hypothetical protein A8139_00720 [Marinomonas primoryensis]